MIDARIQLKELLEQTGVVVKMNYPKDIKTVPLITYFEINNNSTNVKVKDFISYQVDVWGNDFVEVIDIMQEVDRLLTELGLHRDYVSQDSDSVDASGYYRKTLRYSAYVDTRNNRILSN